MKDSVAATASGATLEVINTASNAVFSVTLTTYESDTARLFITEKNPKHARSVLGLLPPRVKSQEPHHLATDSIVGDIAAVLWCQPL